MGFYEKIADTLNEAINYSTTENGALGYRTTGKEILDLNFAVASFRSASDEEIVNRFTKAYYSDPFYAVLWLFYVRDIKEGLGERRLFRVAMSNFIVNELSKDKIEKLITLIPLYGRWDDILVFLGTPYEKFTCNLIKKQMNEDWENYKEGRSVSLLAKWLPSANASSKTSRKEALIICSNIGITEKKYRQTLSALRKYLNVVEVKMSAQQWTEINYSAVPSRANLIYNNAFLRNDETRRREFLAKVEHGEEKINASVLFPHDIVHKYYCSEDYCYSRSLKNKDSSLEVLWKALPDFTGGDNTIVVADGSGSMLSSVGNTQVRAIEVANALAIYFAEHMEGDFKNKYITFSSRPQLVDFSNCDSLKSKLLLASKYDECSNTNIQAVFNLILQTAIDKKMSQKEIPNNVLIISDMEFDSATYTYGFDYKMKARLFSDIAEKYASAGYKLPRLVFWNVNSRTQTIPVKENESGVALVSGFSTNIVKMVLSNQVDPWLCLKEQLDGSRYDAVREVVK